VPDPGPGDIVLRITQAGICGSDLHTWRGDTENNPIPPQGRAMGHEGTGVVYKLGQGVTTDRPSGTSGRPRLRVRCWSRSNFYRSGLGATTVEMPDYYTQWMRPAATTLER
jgi:threonine dehydrogenase-like Zn-dependent dehydrogenase